MKCNWINGCTSEAFIGVFYKRYGLAYNTTRFWHLMGLISHVCKDHYGALWRPGIGLLSELPEIELLL